MSLQLLSEEPSTWRQQSLPQPPRPKQALSLSFRRRLLACSTTSASRCRLRVCLPRPRDGDCQTDRSLPNTGLLTAERWLFLRACPLPALQCMSLQPVTHSFLCSVLRPWPWPSSAPHSHNLSLVCSSQLSACLCLLSLCGCIFHYLPCQPLSSFCRPHVRSPLGSTQFSSRPVDGAPSPGRAVCPPDTRQEKRRARQNQRLRPEDRHAARAPPRLPLCMRARRRRHLGPPLR